MGLAPHRNIKFFRLYEINLYHSNKALNFFRSVRFWSATCFISMLYRGYPVMWIMIKYSDGPSIFLPNFINHSVSPSSVGWHPRIKSAVREQVSNIRMNTEFLLKCNLFFSVGFFDNNVEQSTCVFLAHPFRFVIVLIRSFRGKKFVKLYKVKLNATLHEANKCSNSGLSFSYRSRWPDSQYSGLI